MYGPTVSRCVKCPLGLGTLEQTRSSDKTRAVFHIVWLVRLVAFSCFAVVCVCAFQDEEDHAVHIRLYPTVVSIRLS